MSFVPVTASTFSRMIVLGQTSESRTLEFKAKYRWQKEKYDAAGRAGQAEEMARDVAQFANTDGGTLLVGVDERDPGDGRKLADTIVPIEEVDRFKQWVERAIRNHLTPATFTRSLDDVATDTGVVLAINVPPSLHLVALWHANAKDGIEYLYRTDHGKEWMNPDEVERHIMNGSRAIEIELTRVFEQVSAKGTALRVRLTPPLHMTADHGLGRAQPVSDEDDMYIKPEGCSDREIELHINLKRTPRGAVRIPHALIRAAWQTSDGFVGLCVDMAVVVRGPVIRLEPVPSGI